MNKSIVSRSGASALLAAVVVVFVFGATAMAQVENPSQVTIQGTAVITKDTTGGTTSHSATESGGFLLGYSYQFSRWAGVEGNYGFTRNTQNYLGSFGGSSLQANFHEITGAFVAHIPVNVRRVRPYALAGAGALVFDPTDKFVVSGAARQTKATFLYGGGGDFDVKKKFCGPPHKRGVPYNGPDLPINSFKLHHDTPP